MMLVLAGFTFLVWGGGGGSTTNTALSQFTIGGASPLYPPILLLLRLRDKYVSWKHCLPSL